MRLSFQSCDLILPAANREALSDATIRYARSLLEKKTASYPETWGDSGIRSDMERLTPHWEGPTLVTSSATQAICLALAQMGHGKTLALQTPAYFGVVRRAKELGLNVKTWETVDDQVRLGGFDAVLLTSNHTPPNGQSLSNQEKRRVATQAEKYGAWVIEDNPYDPIWFEHPPTSIPSVPSRTIRIGSLSKIVSPDFRLGFIRADHDVLNRLRLQKITWELSTLAIPQIIARSGITEVMMNNLRSELETRIGVLRTELFERFRATVPMPEGGPYVMLTLPEQIDIHHLAAVSRQHGVMVDENCHQYPDGRNRPYLRLNVGAIESGDIPEAVAALYAAFKLSSFMTTGHAHG